MNLLPHAGVLALCKRPKLPVFRYICVVWPFGDDCSFTCLLFEEEILVYFSLISFSAKEIPSTEK